MKHYIAIVLIFIFLFSFAGCKKEPRSIIEYDNTNENISDNRPEETPIDIPEEPVLKEYSISDGMRFDLPNDYVDRFQSFIIPFYCCGEEFNNASELNDSTLLYTAAIALSTEFALSIDGMSATIPLTKLESKINQYFGGEAELSQEYYLKEYFPYVVDIDNDQLIRYSSGGFAVFLFPYALVEVEEGYELYLIELMDPLFFDDSDNQEKLLSGETVEYSDIQDIALQMQFNIYRLVEQSNGRLMLKSFRYENKKNIVGFIY